MKYRKRWNADTRNALKFEILEQVKSWQPIHMVIFLGERARGTVTPASSLGVLRLIHVDGQLSCSWFSRNLFTDAIEEYRTPWDEIEWGNSHRFQDVFRDVTEGWEASTLIKALSLLESLRKLDSFE